MYTRNLGKPELDQGFKSRDKSDPGKSNGSRFLRAGKSVKAPELPRHLRLAHGMLNAENDRIRN